MFDVCRKMSPEEKELVKLTLEYPIIISQAAHNLNPSILANYLYLLRPQSFLS